jgi:hypothetical protein
LFIGLLQHLLSGSNVHVFGEFRQRLQLGHLNKEKICNLQTQKLFARQLKKIVRKFRNLDLCSKNYLCIIG